MAARMASQVTEPRSLGLGRSAAGSAFKIIEDQLRTRLLALEDAINADCIAYVGPLEQGVHDLFRNALDSLQNRRPKLAVILETSGGYMEIAERVANVLRHLYGSVEYVVPGHAMSAGTVLVMSGDAIHMDYSAVLGPIDPQVPGPGDDSFVPALGYLEKYRGLIDASRDGDLTTAELTYLVQNFHPAELYRYEQEQELSVALLKQWLVKYKFRNWKRTGDRGVRVTAKMRSDRAEEIARLLNDTQRWHSHARGIPMDVLRNDLKLEIDDFGLDKATGPAIRQYYILLKDYMHARAHSVVWHTREGHHGI